MYYWRNHDSVAATDADIPPDPAWVAIPPEQTFPAYSYFIHGNYLTPVDPRTWEKLTGLRAARRKDYCMVCGKFKPCGCRTRYRPHKLRTKTWHANSRGEYYAGMNKLGYAYDADSEWAYITASWENVSHKDALRRINGYPSTPCTFGGPDKGITYQQFRALVNRNKTRAQLHKECLDE